MDESHEHPDQPDVSSRDNLKKWQSVVEERAENCKRTRLDPKETIRLGKIRSDSVGERLCQLFVPTRFF